MIMDLLRLRVPWWPQELPRCALRFALWWLAMAKALVQSLVDDVPIQDVDQSRLDAFHLRPIFFCLKLGLQAHVAQAQLQSGACRIQRRPHPLTREAKREMPKEGHITSRIANWRKCLACPEQLRRRALPPSCSLSLVQTIQASSQSTDQRRRQSRRNIRLDCDLKWKPSSNTSTFPKCTMNISKPISPSWQMSSHPTYRCVVHAIYNCSFISAMPG